MADPAGSVHAAPPRPAPCPLEVASSLGLSNLSLTLEAHAGSLSGVGQAPASRAQFGDSAAARALQPNWLPDSAMGSTFSTGPALHMTEELRKIRRTSYAAGVVGAVWGLTGGA